MVNDSNYPTSDSSVCEQMSSPLTYDDGINLLPKRCENDEAYFACEVPCNCVALIFLSYFVFFL